MKKHKISLSIATASVILFSFVGFVAHAEESTVTTTTVRVSQSCSMVGTTNTAHTATLANGTYSGTNYPNGIGQTTLKAFCNDNLGFAIYAIGYTNDEYGNTKLHNNTLGSTYDINTGIYTSSTTVNSTWSMKLTGVSGLYAPTVSDGTSGTENFTTWHVIPNDYTKVAYRNSGTDVDNSGSGVGSSITATYDAYVSATQPAGTYIGQVKYTLVHPSTMPTPNSTMLDTGQVVSAKMKSLAAGTEKAYNAKTSDIKAIRMASALPNNFVATEANTVSTNTSRHPIYIFFDNTNNAGIMYFYSGDYQVVMNPDSSHLFRSNLALADISGLSTWDSSKVTSMYAMFVDSTISLTNVNALSRWDTSNVENMSFTFAMNKGTNEAGYVPVINSLSGLSNWDVSNVKDMSCMFQNAKQLSSLHGLEFWDVSSVEDMKNMFWNNDRLSSFHGLEYWDVSSVTSMSGMFGMGPGRARYNNAVVDLSPLSRWNVSNVEDMSFMFQNNNIASFLPLSNWNVGNVKNFNNSFNQTSASTTTSLAGLENWDVSSATNVSSMFADSVSLTDASAINGWDVRGVVLGTGNESTIEGFNQMFINSPAHPTFTLRPGTWNSNGTFIPSS
jgi:hypothetical protein